MEGLVLLAMSIIVLGATGIILAMTLVQQRRLCYLEFFRLIERHHSRDLSKLRKKIREDLKDKCITARKQCKSLKDIEPELAIDAATLTNYYEALAILLREGRKQHNLSDEQINLTLKIVEKSTSYMWPIVDEYRDIIYPGRDPKVWATNFEWLYEQVQKL